MQPAFPNMPESDPGPSRRHRQSIFRACNSCRRRHAKCDSVKPICGTCLFIGQECSWTTDSEDSRPATKQYAESLRVKIQHLELEIERIKQANPQFHEVSASSHNPSGTQPGPFVEFQLVPSEHASTDTSVGFSSPQPPYHMHPAYHSGSIVVQSPPTDLPETSSFPSTQFSSTSIAPQQSPPIYQYIYNINTSVPFDQQTPEIQASLSCEWNRYLPPPSTVHLSRLEHDTILSRCFNYGASWLSGLIADLILRDMIDCLNSEATYLTPTRIYTPMLHLALLAFAATFSDDPSLRAPSTRSIFAAHATQWLDEEFNHSSPSLVLSLVLLSEHHCGLGERNTGCMYMEMGIRLARACTHSPVVNPTIRDWYHWSTFVQEKLMALGTKRPSEMSAPQMPIISPIPVELGGRPLISNSIAALFSDKDYSKFVIEGFMQSCKLMVIATRIINNMSHDDSTVIDVHVQLESWLNDLPEGLLMRQRSALHLPHVLSLHICYWWLILHLYLPLLGRAQQPETRPVIDLSAKMCERATEKLVQLISSFDKQFGIRYFPRNMLPAIHTCGCALLLEGALAPDGALKKRALLQEGLDKCILALRLVEDIWPCATTLAEDLEARAVVTMQSSTMNVFQQVSNAAPDPRETYAP